ncbi:MAG: OmpA family protein [Myxococcales bacterium]|nr:OmpA family protein [Myxococcales bacterium]
MPPGSPLGVAPAPKRGRGLLWTALVLALAAGGLGYYSFMLLQKDRTTTQKLDQTSQEVSALQQKTSRDQEQIAALEQAAEQAEAEKGSLKDEAETSRARLAAMESRLQELEEERSEIDARMKEFKKFALSFKRMVDSGRLSVDFRRGRMVVELPATVLFDSGSAELSKDGGDALKEVAKVLRKVPGKRFIVGGHTDNVPVRAAKGEYSSNWALSAARAVVVTEALVASGLRAGNLVAAGYGPHDPVASNGSDAGRQKNRRIEIILEPKVAELPGLKPKAEAKKADGKKAGAKKPAAAAAKKK